MARLKIRRSNFKDKIYVLSDIHMGTNTPTVLYRKEFHEPYLIRTIDYIINNAANVEMVVLLGDIFDFWLYPPEEAPPTFDDILKTHPNILGPNGKFEELLNKLNGRVFYVRGNHDMNITQADLEKINPNGPKIRYMGDFLNLKLTDMYGESILFTHGHNYTMFNAPYITTPPSKISPLPIGYYASRAYAFYVKNTVGDKTVADFPNQKIPDASKASFISLAWQAIQPGAELLDVFISFLNQTTGFSPKSQILLPNNIISTLDEAKYIYKDLYKKWVNDNGGGVLGTSIAIKAAYADYDGSYLPWFAQKLGLEIPVGLVVMGHTHVPKKGIACGVVDYLNTGFMCPAIPDVNSGIKDITFAEIDINNVSNVKTTVYAVKNIVEGNQFDMYNYYRVDAIEPPNDYLLRPGEEDCSCYISMFNADDYIYYMSGGIAQNNVNMTLKDYSCTSNINYYIVPPKKSIPVNTKWIFWLANLVNNDGTAGKVTYESVSGPVTYEFSSLRTPVTHDFSNNCSPPHFKTKACLTNTWLDWVYYDVIEKSGNPFFVQFYSSNTVEGWIGGNYYYKDKVVAFNAKVYKCIKDHSSNVDFTPPNNIECWILLGDLKDYQ